VFCRADDTGGNPLAVFLEGGEVPPAARQGVAADLGLSETVFVDEDGLRIFTPTAELGFAGHPTVGTAWLLAEEGAAVDRLLVPAGELGVRYDGDVSFVSARPEWAPPFEWEELASPQVVDALLGPPQGHDLIGVWAWLDEAAGTVRARVFAPGAGIPEDEATGSAATLLCAELGREIEIHQGRGSRILASPRDGGYVEIGGRSELDDVRDYALP
jgi:predicted PhzF superfamily epimerase YddE/YHI9